MYELSKSRCWMRLGRGDGVVSQSGANVGLMAMFLLFLAGQMARGCRIQRHRAASTASKP